MIDKNQPAEKIAEDILESYAEELISTRSKYYDALEDETKPMPDLFADELQEERQFISPARKIRFKRFVILVAVLVLLLGLALISAEGVKKNMFNFFQKDHAGHTDLTYIGESKEGEGFPDFQITKIPKGYKLVDETDLGEALLISYSNNHEKYIELSIWNTESYSTSVDNDTSIRKEVTINANQGYAFYDENDCLIIWQVGDFTLNLFTNLSLEDTLAIARSIVVNR